MGSHDTLFKHVFSDPDNAAAELRAVLPARIARAVDWSTLRLEPGSFVDSDLAERHCDLLFSADLAGRRAYLYFLFEHRSKPDPWMPLRLAGYVLRIWEDVRRREPERHTLPLVIPVVLHHGPRGWTAARSIAELLDAEPSLIAALGDRVVGLTITVDDLVRITPAAIAARTGPAVALLTLGVLRDTRSLPLGELLARWAAQVVAAARQLEQGDEAFVVLVRYVSEVKKIDSRDAWIDAIRHAVPEDEEVVVAWIDDWRAEGKAEGMAEGRVELVLRQLALKFGALDEATVAAVRGSSIEQLDRIGERVLTATSLDEALDRGARL
jgi:predicted transposase YdaD